MRSTMRNRNCLLLSFILIIIVVTGQLVMPALCTGGSPSAYLPVKEQKNRIQNNKGLKSFYEKLLLLQKGEIDRVSILHIGDSHIQADFITGNVRRNLQRVFGDAGRGLVFPYGVARTNGPVDVKTSSNAPWKYQRNALRVQLMPTGIAGVSLTTESPGTVLEVSLSQSVDDGGLPGNFTGITLFHDKGSDAFEFLAIDDSGTAYTAIDESGDRAKYVSTYLVPPLSRIRFMAFRSEDGRNYGRIYGISLENGKNGVLYHMAGVNGATFASFNDSALFAPHLGLINPDLIVVSLGTNDINERTYQAADVRVRMEALLATIHKNTPEASIILTVPPDFGKTRNSFLKQKILSLRETMTALCRAQGLPWWDLFDIMGGYGSIEKWKKNGLVQQDLVHFTRPGYGLIGTLFYRALMKGYHEHASPRHR